MYPPRWVMSEDHEAEEPAGRSAEEQSPRGTTGEEQRTRGKKWVMLLQKAEEEGSYYRSVTPRAHSLAERRIHADSVGIASVRPYLMLLPPIRDTQGTALAA